jgi:hypothetical protein
MRWIASVATLVASLAPAGASAQQTMLGVVLEDATRRPLAGAEVRVRAATDSTRPPEEARTDSAGRFRLGITDAVRFRLEVRKPGFEVLVTPALALEILTSGPIELVLRPAQSGVAALVRGRVVDSTGEPIGFAQVRVGPSGEQVTDDAGRFDVALRVPGRLAVAVRRIGYRPLELSLPAMPDTALRLVLNPLVGTLETVHIDADRTVASLDRAGFYSRLRDHERGANTGYFISPEEIDRRRPIRVSAMLEGIPGIKVLPISSKRYAVHGTNGCSMTVFMDGIRISSLSAKVATDIDEIVAPTTLAGIEVYSRANAPSDYRIADGTCGVLLMWGK